MFCVATGQVHKLIDLYVFINWLLCVSCVCYVFFCCKHASASSRGVNLFLYVQKNIHFILETRNSLKFNLCKFTLMKINAFYDESSMTMLNYHNGWHLCFTIMFYSIMNSLFFLVIFFSLFFAFFGSISRVISFK